MTVKSLQAIIRFIGLSTDIKPTSVVIGSTFYAYDTELMYITPDGTNWVVKGALSEGFSGDIYENQNTASADTARRFETSSKKLRDVLIRVDTYAQYFGDSSNQRYEVGVGDVISFTKVDISTLYFKNKTAGANGVVTILGVEE